MVFYIVLYYMVSQKKISIKNFNSDLFITLIDDYAKDGDQRWSDIYVVFTKILCGHNFCVW